MVSSSEDSVSSSPTQVKGLKPESRFGDAFVVPSRFLHSKILYGRPSQDKGEAWTSLRGLPSFQVWVKPEPRLDEVILPIPSWFSPQRNPCSVHPSRKGSCFKFHLTRHFPQNVPSRSVYVPFPHPNYLDLSSSHPGLRAKPESFQRADLVSPMRPDQKSYLPSFRDLRPKVPSRFSHSYHSIV